MLGSRGLYFSFSGFRTSSTGFISDDAVVLAKRELDLSLVREPLGDLLGSLTVTPRRRSRRSRDALLSVISASFLKLRKPRVARVAARLKYLASDKPGRRDTSP
jgi:hypothetical protein